MIGRLFGPVDLLLFSEDYVVCVGVMNNDSALEWWRKSWNDLFEKLILALVCSTIKLKHSLKMLAIWNGPITVAPLCVSIYIFDACECLIAIKLFILFHKFLSYF